MRPSVVAANWKMHLDPTEASALSAAIRHYLDVNTSSSDLQIILFPPFPYLGIVRNVVAGSAIGLGAQNMHNAVSGAFTGEVSSAMLRAMGCSWVLLGHSERRQHFGESDAFINSKISTAFAQGLTPVFCVGETLEQREQGDTEQVIETQIRKGLTDVQPRDIATLIIAYEPVWAIGTGRTATPVQAQEVHGFIRNLIANMYSRQLADTLVILYGGSVKTDNAAELFSQADVDGGLIGGASLDAAAFTRIIQAAQASARG